ncbi:MAG TPA: murein biosynthesis integral membrane protein MurJ [Actinomycetes bacterium]|nr:murein biosynthesis integral membrane protein MurJ [Actinomycetes bacterium]
MTTLPSDNQFMLRSSSVMAVGTVTSRVTGLVKNSALLAAVGSGVLADTYSVANTLPTIVYILLIGGAINAVFIPQLVRHMDRDEDGGTAYAQRLFSAVVGVLAVITVGAVIAAPLLVRLYSTGWTDQDIEVATTFARLLLPQIFFYGVFALVSQVLNTRGKFGAPMFAPVVNNIVTIASALAFIAVAGTGPTTDSVTDSEIVILGLGTTLGAVAQSIVLWPPLRRCGVRLRLRADLKGAGLGKAWTLARWAIILVLVNQLGLLIVSRLATGVNATSDADAGVAVYQMAFVIFMLPQSVITVSLVTALLPSLSQRAAEGRLDVVRERLAWTLRTSGSVMIPATAAFIVLGVPIAVLLFRHGSMSLESARLLGLTLSAFAIGLPAFSAYYILMRGFYALEDTRTPTLNAMIQVGVNIVLAVAAVHWLSADWAIPGLGLAYAISYWVGLVALATQLRRRLERLDGYLVVRTHVRVVLASLIATAAMVAGSAIAVTFVGRAVDITSSLVVVVTGLVFGAAGYLVGVRVFRITEVSDVLSLIARRR